MAKYYWTINKEEDPRYHTNTGCFEGLKIKKENRREGDSIPADRTLCEECWVPSLAPLGLSLVPLVPVPFSSNETRVPLAHEFPRFTRVVVVGGYNTTL